jgi:hypothetical protein
MADLPSTRSTEAPSSQSTRQLLEELDDLMQRMLELPVQNAEEEQAPTEPARPSAPSTNLEVPAGPAKMPRGVQLLHVPATRVTIQAPLSGQPAKDVAASPSSAVSPPSPVREPSPQREQRPDPLTAPTYVPVGAEQLLPILLQPPGKGPAKEDNPKPQPVPTKSPAPRPSATPAPRPSWTTPQATASEAAVQKAGWLVTVNQAFDSGTMLLGGVGRWLRGEQGRSIIGWSGIAMIVVALLWAAILFLD